MPDFTIHAVKVTVEDLEIKVIAKDKEQAEAIAKTLHLNLTIKDTYKDEQNE